MGGEDGADGEFSGAERAEDANVFSFLEDDHDQRADDIEGGDDADEEEDDEHDALFHLDGAEEGGVLVHPGFDGIAGAEGILEAVADEGGVFNVIEADFEGVDARAEGVELLTSFEGDEAEVGIIVVVAGVEVASDGEFFVHGDEGGAAGGADTGGSGELNFVAEAEAHLFGDLIADDNLVVGDIEGTDSDEALEVGGVTFEFGVNAEDKEEAHTVKRAEEERAGDIGSGGLDLRELAGGFGGDVPVGEGVTAGAKDGNVGVHADDAIFKFFFKAGHDGQDDNEGGDTDGDTENGDEREEGDKALVAAGAHEVAKGGDGFVVHRVAKAGMI